MNYLVVVAHPDDEVLGAGATIRKLIKQGNNVAVAIMSGHAAARSNISLKEAVVLHEVEKKNPSAQLTFARDLGIIDNESLPTDISLLLKCGVISYPELALAVFSKRNVTKFEAIPVKPLVLLAKLFSSFYKLGIRNEERFVTAYECKEYLSVLSSYDEYTDDVALTIVNSRKYSHEQSHVPNQPGNTPVQWLCIFNLLDGTPLFTLGEKPFILKAIDSCQNLIQKIATSGERITLAPTIVGKNNAPLYEYYSKFETGIIEIIPELHLLAKDIPAQLTRDLFDYLFGVNITTYFDWGSFFKEDCKGIYKDFFPIRNLVIAKIFFKHKNIGEHLFDYLSQAG